MAVVGLSLANTQLLLVAVLRNTSNLPCIAFYYIRLTSYIKKLRHHNYIYQIFDLKFMQTKNIPSFGLFKNLDSF